MEVLIRTPIHLTFQLFGYKIDDRSANLLLNAIDESVKLLQPTGPLVLMDIAPWTRHFMRKTYGQLVDVARYTRLWIDKETEKRKVIYILQSIL